VRRVDERIRISVQLVDTQSNKNLWSRTYDRKVADVFELQDEISSTLAASLMADLTRAEGERAQQRGIKNLDAWSAYELGMERLTRVTPKDAADARELFEQALVLEPQSASATAALSGVYSLEVILAWTDSPKSNATKALDLAHRAVKLDQDNAAAHTALAYALTVAGDFQSAIASAERSVELNPSAPDGWWALAYAKELVGDLEGAVAAIEQSIRLDPQSNNTARYLDFLSMTDADRGQYEAGLAAARKVIASHPDYAWGYIDLAVNAFPLGRIDEARAAIVEARRLQPNLSRASIQKSLGSSRPDIDARRNVTLSQAGLD
jgi:adenylate cyclase